MLDLDLKRHIMMRLQVKRYPLGRLERRCSLHRRVSCPLDRPR